MAEPDPEEIKPKIDPDDPSVGHHAVLVQENAEVKEEIEQKLICCPVCNAVFPGSLALFDHLEEHANAMFDDQSDDGASAANDLGEAGVLSSESEIERDTGPKAVYEEVPDLRETQEEVTGFTCDYCSSSFHSKWRLIRHFDWDHKVKSSENQPKNGTGLQTNSGCRNLICKYCSISLAHKWSLKRHFERLHKEKMLNCHHCSKGFVEKNELKKHFLISHNFQGNKKDSGYAFNDERGTYICYYCNKTITDKLSLHRHIQRRHGRSNLPQRSLYKTVEEISKLTCFFCNGKKFRHRKALRKHLVQSHDVRLCVKKTKLFSCELCSENFNSKTDIIDHFRIEHKIKTANAINTRGHHCKLCNKTYLYPNRFARHLLSKGHLKRTSTEGVVSCLKCSKKFHSTQLLYQHIKRYHSRAYTCDYCSKRIKNPGQMQLHVVSHVCFEIDEKTGTKTWTCNVCEKVFPNNEQFNTHHINAHPYQQSFHCPYPECSTKIKKEGIQWGIIQSHLAAHKRGYNGFYCFECGKLVKKYFVHYMSHKVSYICDHCGKQFTSKPKMKDHISSIHLKDTQYVCELCGKSFKNTAARRQHFSEHHAPKKEFTCDICGIKKNSKQMMRNHMVWHQQIKEEDKPHKCSTCGKRFRLKSTLDVHELTHSGIKPFSCSVCNRAFSQSCSMRRHMRQHTGEEPYKCKECDKGFKQSSSLKAHIHVHHNPDRKRCEICEKSFRTDVALRKHLEEHVGEGNGTKETKKKTKKKSVSQKTNALNKTTGKSVQKKSNTLKITNGNSMQKKTYSLRLRKK